MKREALWHRAEEAAGEQEVLGLTISSRAKYAHGGQPPPCRFQPVPRADSPASQAVRDKPSSRRGAGPRTRSRVRGEISGEQFGDTAPRAGRKLDSPIEMLKCFKQRFETTYRASALATQMMVGMRRT